jgi:hypothetical protein
MDCAKCSNPNREPQHIKRLFESKAQLKDLRQLNVLRWAHQESHTRLKSMRFTRVIPLLLLLFSAHSYAATTEQGRLSSDQGIRFSCRPEQLKNIEADFDAYLNALNIDASLVIKKTDQANGIVLYTLNTPNDDTNTLDLHSRAALQIKDEIVFLPELSGKDRKVSVVSKKEILLALLQHGRLTEFKGAACDVHVLKDHIGIRQNIAAWSEKLYWVFPNGRRAKWHKKYWTRGTPTPGFPLHQAVADVFLNQDKYSIGCYAAAKLLIMQGILDYYVRIEQNPLQLSRLEIRLNEDNEALENIEPGRMWSFEDDFNQQEMSRPGKLVRIKYGVAAKNFIPGDWIYILNTDPVSHKKIGYEGSNPIYLGRNKFADYYNDNKHAYSYEQKIDEVYQWRNGVFSRSRDFAKIERLLPQDMERLSKTPANGGLMNDLRVFPYHFGHEELPELNAPLQMAR